MIEEPQKYYRIVDGYSAESEPRVEEWLLLRKTPAGAWVCPRWIYYHAVKPLEERPARALRDNFRAKFVLDGKGRRYCYPTIDLARDSYRRRKMRQIQHARNSIERAQAALTWLETGKVPKGDLSIFRAQPGA